MFSRLIQLIGEDKMNKIKHASVLIFGLGGVGGNAAEAIVRSGYGTLILVDNDTVELSNINRQLVATTKTINRKKVEVLKERLLEINPNVKIITYNIFYDFETKDVIWKHKIDYVIDCIDTITFKIDIVRECQLRNIPLISVMGTGNKYHPEKLEIIQLSKTEYDPIARVMRNKLKKDFNLNNIMVVASKEVPTKVDSTKQSPSSNAFVPNTAGIIAASYIFNKTIE